MKRLILPLCLLCGLYTAARAQTGIGINTLNPQGILHIDGTGNNPASGSVSPAEAEDDVIIDPSGRVGIGLPNPATRVDILPKSSGTPGPPLIRIQDGTAETGAYLFSDDDGTGAWAHVAVGSWYAALYNDYSSPLLGSSGSTLDVREFTSYDGELISPTGGGDKDATAGTITVPATGKYRISLDIYWENSRINGNFKCIGILRLNRGGSLSDLWSFTSWGGRINESVQPTFIKILNLEAGDVLSLATDERAANNPNDARVHLFLVERLR
jgi:hypothetical protein